MTRTSKHTTILQEVSLSDELRELHPEYPFPFALRGIYDDVWGTTPVPGDPTEDKYPHRQYPPSLKKQAGTTYGLLSSLLAQRGNLRKLLKIRCGCGNEYVVPDRFYPKPFSDCGCCIEHTMAVLEKELREKMSVAVAQTQTTPTQAQPAFTPAPEPTWPTPSYIADQPAEPTSQALAPIQPSPIQTESTTVPIPTQPATPAPATQDPTPESTGPRRYYAYYGVKSNHPYYRVSVGKVNDDPAKEISASSWVLLQPPMPEKSIVCQKFDESDPNLPMGALNPPEWYETAVTPSSPLGYLWGYNWEIEDNGYFDPYLDNDLVMSFFPDEEVPMEERLVWYGNDLTVNIGRVQLMKKLEQDMANEMPISLRFIYDDKGFGLTPTRRHKGGKITRSTHRFYYPDRQEELAAHHRTRLSDLLSLPNYQGPDGMEADTSTVRYYCAACGCVSYTPRKWFRPGFLCHACGHDGCATQHLTYGDLDRTWDTEEEISFDVTKPQDNGKSELVVQYDENGDLDLDALARSL